MIIRDAVPADEPTILALMREAGEMSPLYDYTHLRGGTMLVADEDGELLGYVRFDLGTPETYVRSVAVRRDRRAQRVARRLIGEVWAQAVAFGAHGIQGVASSPEAAALWGNRECATLQATMRVRTRYTDYVKYLEARPDDLAAREVLDRLRGLRCP